MNSLEMKLDEYQQYDAVGLAALVAAGEVSPEELLACALAAVDAVNDRLGAVVKLAPDAARRLIAQGLPEGPLRGVPFLLKDLGAEARDFPSDNGSKLLADTRYPYDSELYLRLRRAGLVSFGRSAAPELGIGPVTEAQAYPRPARNPWHTDRTPGGSSGGAGAAVAAGIVPAAHGSDGGGSVRIPAANCALFGLKPTRARLPDGPAAGEGWGGMAIDGFLSRSVRDSAVLLDACAGADLGAPYHAPPLRDGFRAALERPPGRLRIAFTTGTFGQQPLHPDCRRAVERAAELAAGLGHEVDERTPRLEVRPLMLAWSKIVACGTALAVNKALAARGRSRAPDGAGTDIEGVTRAACVYAAGLSGEDYLDALNQVHAFGRELAGFFQDWDVLITATLAEPPAAVGRFKPDHRDFLRYRMEHILPYSPYAPLYNASGQPAASLPLHWNEQRLPIGVQFATRFGEDETLMALSAQLEQASPWFDLRSPLRARDAASLSS